MTSITSSKVRQMIQNLSQNTSINKADVDGLVDAAMDDKVLSISEKKALQEFINQNADKLDQPETKQRLQSFLDIQNGQLRSLAHKLERDDGVLDIADAGKLVDLAKADGKIDGQETFSLRAMMIGSKMTAPAKAKIEQETAGLVDNKTWVEESVFYNVQIPDNNADGIESRAAITEQGLIEAIRVEVDIDHSYKGDLELSLVGPDGTEVALHKRSGGSADNLVGVFGDDLQSAESLDAFKGKEMTGDWKLRVRDLAGRDVGKLTHWKLSIAKTETTQPSTPAFELGKTASLEPVFVSTSGHFVLDAANDKPADNASLGSAMFRAARLVDDAKTNPFTGDAVDLATKTKMFANIQESLAMVAVDAPRPADMTEIQALQLRSSNVTVLRELMASLGSNRDDLALKLRAFDSYKQVLTQETNPALRDSMIFNLHAIKDKLTPAMKQVSDSFVNEMAPTHPPYEEWFKDGNRTLNVSWTSGQGEEFISGTRALLEKQGFVREGVNSKFFSKKMTGSDGEEYTIRIKTKVNHNSIFDDMGDENMHILGYDGHSDFGRAVPDSLRGAPEEAGKKLVFTGLCSGKDNINTVRDAYPDAQLLTTYTSSYFNTTKVDGKTQMSRSENFNTLMVLVKDSIKRKPWTTINKDIRDEAILFPWNHVMPGGTNYISPVHTMIRRRLLDTDHDGQADILDKLVDFDTHNVNENTYNEFVATDPGYPADKLDGSRVHIATMGLNTETGYNSETQDYKRSNIIGGGFFEPKPGDPILRFDKDVVDGQKVLYLRVNKNYAHMSADALRAVASYQMIQDISVDSHRKPQENKLLGLIFATASLAYDSGWSSRDQQIWSGLLGAMNLPQDIPFAPFKRLIDAEHHDYTGNMTHVRTLLKDLPASTIDALK